MKQRTRTFVLGLLLLGAVCFGSPRLAETAHFSVPAIHSHAIGGSKGGTVSPIAGGKGGGVTNLQ